MINKILKNRLKYFLSLSLILFVLAVPLISRADILPNPLGDDTKDVSTLLVNIIKVIVSGLGVFGVFMVIYGGFLFLIAGGNEETIKKAKATLVWAVIGLAVILTSRIIIGFVASSLGQTSAEIVRERSAPCSPAEGQPRMCSGITGDSEGGKYGMDYMMRCTPEPACQKIDPIMTHCCWYQ